MMVTHIGGLLESTIEDLQKEFAEAKNDKVRLRNLLYEVWALIQDLEDALEQLRELEEEIGECLRGECE